VKDARILNEKSEDTMYMSGIVDAGRRQQEVEGNYLRERSQKLKRVLEGQMVEKAALQQQKSAKMLELERLNVEKLRRVASEQNAHLDLEVLKTRELAKQLMDKEYYSKITRKAEENSTEKESDRTYMANLLTKTKNFWKDRDTQSNLRRKNYNNVLEVQVHEQAMRQQRQKDDYWGRSPRANPQTPTSSHRQIMKGLN
jgi:hypothetical protein